MATEPEIRETTDVSAGLAETYRLRKSIYRTHAHWSPLPRWIQKRIFDRRSNPFWQAKEVRHFSAFRNGRICAGVFAFFPLNAEARIGEISLFESLPDETAASAVLGRASSWLQENRCHTVRGPWNPTISYEPGVLVEGFRIQPSIGTSYNPPYYDSLFLKSGFRKLKDLLGYSISTDLGHSARLDKLSEKMASDEIKIRPLDKGRARDEIEVFLTIRSQTFSGDWTEPLLSREEAGFLFRIYTSLLDPKLCLIAEYRGAPVGYLVAVPNGSLLLRAFARYSAPMGLFAANSERRSFGEARVILFGVIPSARSRGAQIALFRQLWQEFRRKGYHTIELSWIAEDNTAMVNWSQNFGFDQDKRWRLYEKALTAPALVSE